MDFSEPRVGSPHTGGLMTLGHRLNAAATCARYPYVSHRACVKHRSCGFLFVRLLLVATPVAIIAVIRAVCTL